MHIDRNAFLFFTGAIAAASCNQGPPAQSANVVEIPAQPVASSSALAMSTAAPRPPDPRPVAPIAISEADDGDDGDMPTPMSEGLGGTADADDGCGFVKPSTVVRPSGACNDAVGAPARCDAMRSCSGFAFPREQCEDFRRNYKPKVAERALSCLVKLSAKQVCDACNTYRCGDMALKTSCPDPTADATCASIAQRCRSVSMSECRLYLSGMNATGRAKMSKCLGEKSGCSFGIYSCSESI